MAVKRLVIDVLIPLDPDIIKVSERIAELHHVDGVTIHVIEIDEKTRTIEVTIEGDNLSFADIEKVIEDCGGSIHSLDMVSTGKKLIDSQVTRLEEE
ncbi:MAG: DUF211 domain-containing protein [Dehalococcoidales bacterium]|nr:DUF211 domain-containing protein [Dehalococcoidales bacterium]